MDGVLLLGPKGGRILSWKEQRLAAKAVREDGFRGTDFEFDGDMMIIHTGTRKVTLEIGLAVAALHQRGQADDFLARFGSELHDFVPA